MQIRIATFDGELHQILVYRRKRADGACRRSAGADQCRERIEVDMTDAFPIHVLDRKLDRPLGLADEIVLIETEIAIEFLDRRDGRLADDYGPDFLRFDKHDPA